jgi:hypothetical protein
MHPGVDVWYWSNFMFKTVIRRHVPGFASILFTSPFVSSRPKLLGCFHTRTPVILGPDFDRYADVESFLNLQIQAEMADLCALLRRTEADHGATGRAFATTLTTAAGEGHFAEVQKLYGRTQEHHGVKIQLNYGDVLVQWMNTADFTYWFISRIFEFPGASDNQPAFSAAELGRVRDLGNEWVTKDMYKFRPEHVQPYLSERLSQVRDLALLGFTNKEIGEQLRRRDIPVKGISAKTYMKDVFTAYNETTRSGLVVEFLRRGGTAEYMLDLARQYELLPDEVRDRYRVMMDVLRKTSRGEDVGGGQCSGELGSSAPS